MCHDKNYYTGLRIVGEMFFNHSGYGKGMGKKKPPHRTVKIPIELYNRVDIIVSQHMFGYRNQNEFMKDAVRRYLIELGIFEDELKEFE